MMRLVHVLSYSCMNCLRSFSALEALRERYRKEGLLVQLVHPPEWEFEKNISIVREGLKRHGITLPLLHDPGKKAISAWGINFWPAQLLLEGHRAVYSHLGEGGYVELEDEIRKRLRVGGRRVFTEEPVLSAHPCIYFGKRKGEGMEGQYDLGGDFTRGEESLRIQGNVSFSAPGERAFAVCRPGSPLAALHVSVNGSPPSRIRIPFPDIYPLADTSPGDELVLSTSGAIELYAVAFA